MNQNPFPLQLNLIRSLKPKTPFEEKNRDDVRSLRQQEEKSALKHMEQGYDWDNKNVEERMERHKQEILSEVKELLDQQRKKIHREEIEEEKHGKEHEKDHGEYEHERKVLSLIESLRNKERKNVQKDMKNAHREDRRRAVTGMRENQRKDEDQIVRITREVARKKVCPKCGQYPCVCGR